jgi:hypothetical protein
MRPGDPRWEKAAELAGRPQGATSVEVAAALGHKNPKGSTCRLLNRMVVQGVIRTIKLSNGKRGPDPYLYIAI